MLRSGNTVKPREDRASPPRICGHTSLALFSHLILVAWTFIFLTIRETILLLAYGRGRCIGGSIVIKLRDARVLCQSGSCCYQNR